MYNRNKNTDMMSELTQLEKVDKEINEINSKEGLEYYLKQNK